MFGVVVDLILGCAVGEGCDVGIVAVNQDTRLLVFEYRRQQLGGPKDPAMFCRPGIVRVAIQPMYEDNVNAGWLRRGDFS